MMEFLKFLDISRFFKKEPETRTEIIKKAHNLLVHNALDAYYDLMKNGYQPPKNQIEIFNYRLSDFMKEKHPIVGSLIEKGYKLNPKNIVNFLETISDMYDITIYSADNNLNIIKIYELYRKNKLTNKMYTHYNENEAVYKEIINNYKNADIQSELLRLFILHSDKDITRTKGMAEYMAYSYALILPETFAEIPQSQYLHITKKLFDSRNLKVSDGDPEYEQKIKYIEKPIGGVIARISEKMQQDFTSIYSNEMKNLVDETKTHFLSEYATQTALAESISSINKDFEKNTLPKQATEYIDIIKNDYVFIVKSSEPSQQISKLVNEELPTVISRYISMLPENRLTMVNSQGKNSEEILNESLLKISELLKEQVNVLQKDNLTEMSVHNRVLKAKTI